MSVKDCASTLPFKVPVPFLSGGWVSPFQAQVGVLRCKVGVPFQGGCPLSRWVSPFKVFSGGWVSPFQARGKRWVSPFKVFYPQGACPFPVPKVPVPFLSLSRWRVDERKCCLLISGTLRCCREIENTQLTNREAPATPRPAATVMVIRDSEAGLEVFMVRRHHEIDFASGALVFPGGKNDPQDEDPRLLDLCDGVRDDLRVYRTAAVREAFEECGVLLARKNGQKALVSGPDMLDLDPWRNRLHKGESTLHDFLTTENLRLACDLLIRFAHWVTPTMVPRRFDTQFFLVPAPVDQLLVHDGHESVDSLWIRPQDAIRGADDGTYTIIFPTVCNLQKLGLSSTVAEAIDAAKGAAIVEVLPISQKVDDGYFMMIPEAAGYPHSRVKLPKDAPQAMKSRRAS